MIFEFLASVSIAHSRRVSQLQSNDMIYMYVHGYPHFTFSLASSSLSSTSATRDSWADHMEGVERAIIGMYSFLKDVL